MVETESDVGVGTGVIRSLRPGRVTDTVDGDVPTGTRRLSTRTPKT